MRIPISGQPLVTPRGVKYTLVESSRAKWIRLEVSKDGGVKLVIPRNSSLRRADRFFERKQAWVLRKLGFFRNFTGPYLKRGGLRAGRRTYLKYKPEARRLILSRLEHFNKAYGFSWRRVSIKNHKSRWGSCSKRGNLNFNYRIAMLPPDLADYIIIHELCHLKELNHSKAFWTLVGQTCPEYKLMRHRLMHNGFPKAGLI